jgi:predicted transglutaminase-like cysteine proteinase
MSASSWAICPRCKANRQCKAEDARMRATAAYGITSIQEFDRLRDEAERLEAEVNADTNATRSFREDYEFYGIEDGEATARYSGCCATCGLSLSFEHSQAVEL